MSHFGQNPCTTKLKYIFIFSLCYERTFIVNPHFATIALNCLTNIENSAFRNEYIRSPCPTPCSIFCKDYTGTWVCFDVPNQDYQDCQVSAFWRVKATLPFRTSAITKFPYAGKTMWRSICKHFATYSATQVWVCRVWTICPFPRTTTTGYMNRSLLTWNLAIFFSQIPTKPATILTPNSRDWWTNVIGKGPYLPMSLAARFWFCVCYRALTTTRSYSILCPNFCFKHLMHTQISGTQRISRSLNVISYPKTGL